MLNQCSLIVKWASENIFHSNMSQMQLFSCMKMNLKMSPKNCRILIQISLKYVPRLERPALAYQQAIMWTNDQWLPSLLTHICFCRSQCFNKPLQRCLDVVRDFANFANVRWICGMWFMNLHRYECGDFIELAISHASTHSGPHGAPILLDDIGKRKLYPKSFLIILRILPFKTR